MKQNNIEIREMEFEDLQKVFAVGEEIFTAEKWSNLYRTWDEYEILNHFTGDKEFCLVAESEKEIVGFVLAAVVEKKSSAWKYGYITWIGVLPNHNSVGSKLLKKVTSIFKGQGVRMLIADTEMKNKRALKFFEKHGFGDPSEHVYLFKNIDDI